MAGDARRKYLKIKNNPVLFSWMAGIIDGEGTITICAMSHYRQLVPKIAVSNTNVKCIRPFVKSFGGKIRLRSRTDKNWKACYEWSLTSEQAVAVIDKLKPYLKMKSKQADLAMKMQSIKRSMNSAEKRWNRAAQKKIHDKCYKLKIKIQLLNKRGLL